MGDDLLLFLLCARAEEGGAGMTDKQLRDEAMTLFLAGTKRRRWSFPGPGF